MSFLLEIIRLGLTNLRLHLLRSSLTALGIIFGVTAVILMLAIGEGSKQSALERIEALGAKNIIIRSVKPPETTQQTQGQQQGWQLSYGLTRSDLDVIEENFPRDDAIAVLKSVGGQVLRDVYKLTSQAFGTTPDLKEIANLRVARGRYLTWDDLDRRLNVAVVGHEVARALFPFDDALFNTFRIDTQVFTVVGVLEPIGLSGGAGAALVGRDLNHDIHVPLTTAYNLFGDVVVRRSSGSFSADKVEVSEIYYTSPTRDDVLIDASMLRRIMQVRHPKMNDVNIIVPYELLESAKRTALTWQIVLSAIASISLAVGGIGIMNIMLATVTERTREIGIRRALGATRRHITYQFVVETGVLSAIGGLLGVVAGVGLAFLFDRAADQFEIGTDLSAQVTGWSIIVSFCVATSVGLIFGIYPAIVAARQDPIVALRHD